MHARGKSQLLDLNLCATSALSYPRALHEELDLQQSLFPGHSQHLTNAHQHVSCMASNPTQTHDNDQGISDVLKALLKEKSVARKELVLQLWRDIAMKG